jgi:hypothetical protein
MNDFSAKHPVRRALFAALLAGTAFSCLVSCSKPAPETPMERSRVLLRLFSNLERRENEAALNNLETYRNFDPTNLDLTQFEHIIRANRVIESARAKLEAGDAAGASAELDAYCLKYGDASPSVTKAKADVDLLLEAQRLNDRLLAASFSDDLRAAATDLRVFARKNFLLFPELYDYASVKIQDADALAADEKKDACVAIFQDILNTAGAPRNSKDAGTAAVLAALLELNADPGQIAGFETWLYRAGESANP